MIDTVTGITKYSLGTNESDKESAMDSNMNGLKIDIINLFPTFGLLNRTSEVFNPFGAQTHRLLMRMLIGNSGPKDPDWACWKKLVIIAALLRI